jgi:protein transport protein SEC24
MGFRIGSSTKLDDRVFALEQAKTLPLMYLMLEIYPSLYPVHALDDKNVISKGDLVIPQPPILQLSSAHTDRHGAYLMDTGSRFYMWIAGAISDHWCQEVLDVPNFKSIQDGMTELPELENATSDRLRTFINHLNDQRPFPASLLIIREDSRLRNTFLQHMVEDRTESTMSYYEFLQHLQKEIKS